ncbi:DUF2787 family protein [Gallaecimonas pentaromativorans]|uniref:DUF2787 family protein n=1 Tax=Gallaecimonas pentaromativorans TaxID=584787 RepID=UPI00067ECECC|nr:DUF2787 family protein [Gallaecimonas pentaromativorans]
MVIKSPCHDAKLSTGLRTLLSATAAKHPHSESLTLNFRDPNYSPDAGGYHPVEIRMSKAHGDWYVEYLTDFAYYGPPGYAELARELDFNLLHGIGYQNFVGDVPLRAMKSLFRTWQQNFLAYHQWGVFRLTVTSE